jgi:hypothetical protein
MFEQVFENLQKITEANAKAQQELFKKWVGLFPGAPTSPPAFGEQFQQFPKKWVETVQALIKRQREYLEAQFKVGLENIEKAFAVGEAKTAEELRVKTIELWKKCFETLKKGYEVQLHEIQAATEKWVELVTECTV